MTTTTVTLSDDMKHAMREFMKTELQNNDTPAPTPSLRKQAEGLSSDTLKSILKTVLGDKFYERALPLDLSVDLRSLPPNEVYGALMVLDNFKNKEQERLLRVVEELSPHEQASVKELLNAKSIKESIQWQPCSWTGKHTYGAYAREGYICLGIGKCPENTGWQWYATTAWKDMFVQPDTLITANLDLATYFVSKYSKEAQEEWALALRLIKLELSKSQ